MLVKCFKLQPMSYIVLFNNACEQTRLHIDINEVYMPVLQCSLHLTRSYLTLVHASLCMLIGCNV